MPSSGDDGSSNDGSEYYNSESDDDLSRVIFGKNDFDKVDKNQREHTIYCAICAGKHSEPNCPNKVYSKSE